MILKKRCADFFQTWVRGGCLQSVEMVPFDRGTDHFLMALNGTRDADSVASQSLDTRSERQVVTLDTLSEYLENQGRFRLLRRPAAQTACKSLLPAPHHGVCRRDRISQS